MMMKVTTFSKAVVFLLLCMVSVVHASTNARTSSATCLTGILFKGVDKRIEELERKNTLLTKQMTLLTSQMNHFLYGRRGVFSATRTIHTTLNKGQTLVFDVVRYNPGQDYNPGTGVFTCPIHGVYQFHLAILTDSKGKISTAEIVKSGVQIGYLWEQGVLHSTSVTVFTECDKGEKVWVRAPRSIFFWGNGFPYFSGAFMHPLK